MKTNTGIGVSVHGKTSAAAAAVDGGYAGQSADCGRKPSLSPCRQSQDGFAEGYSSMAMEERYGIREEGIF